VIVWRGGQVRNLENQLRLETLWGGATTATRVRGGRSGGPWGAKAGADQANRTRLFAKRCDRWLSSYISIQLKFFDVRGARYSGGSCSLYPIDLFIMTHVI
jgi:hypothetical protein